MLDLVANSETRLLQHARSTDGAEYIAAAMTERISLIVETLGRNIVVNHYCYYYYYFTLKPVA